MPLQEYAVEYTRAERIQFIVRGTLAGAAVILLCKLWLFPELKEFAASAPCRTVLGIAGIRVLWFGLFVGMPLMFTVVTAFSTGRPGYKILRDGQFPSKDQKVFKPTRIVRGWKSVLVGLFHILFPFLTATLALWGASQAEELSKQGSLKPLNCALNHSVERTGLRSAAHFVR